MRTAPLRTAQGGKGPPVPGGPAPRRSLSGIYPDSKFFSSIGAERARTVDLDPAGKPPPGCRIPRKGPGIHLGTERRPRRQGFARRWRSPEARGTVRGGRHRRTEAVQALWDKRDDGTGPGEPQGCGRTRRRKDVRSERHFGDRGSGSRNPGGFLRGDAPSLSGPSAAVLGQSRDLCLLPGWGRVAGTPHTETARHTGCGSTRPTLPHPVRPHCPLVSCTRREPAGPVPRERPAAAEDLGPKARGTGGGASPQEVEYRFREALGTPLRRPVNAALQARRTGSIEPHRA